VDIPHDREHAQDPLVAERTGRVKTENCAINAGRQSDNPPREIPQATVPRDRTPSRHNSPAQSHVELTHHQPKAQVSAPAMVLRDRTDDALCGDDGFTKETPCTC
jgi:hypothetical protein